jgi:hypothetical protein
MFCTNCGRNLKQTTAPSSSPSTSYAGGIDPDASAAKTLTLVAIILQIVFFVFGIIIVSIFFAATTAFSTASSITFVQNGTTFTAPFFPGGNQLGGAPTFAFGFLGLFFAVGFLISVIWVVLDYFLIYRNLQTENTIATARTPALALGILQLLFAGFIPGILLIVAYVKVGDSMRRRGLSY